MDPSEFEALAEFRGGQNLVLLFLVDSQHIVVPGAREDHMVLGRGHGHGKGDVFVHVHDLLAPGQGNVDDEEECFLV